MYALYCKRHYTKCLNSFPKSEKIAGQYNMKWIDPGQILINWIEEKIEKLFHIYAFFYSHRITHSLHGTDKFWSYHEISHCTSSLFYSFFICFTFLGSFTRYFQQKSDHHNYSTHTARVARRVFTSHQWAHLRNTRLSSLIQSLSWQISLCTAKACA